MVLPQISGDKTLEKLGRCGTDVMYKTHDTKLDRIVALTFLSHQLTPDESDKLRSSKKLKPWRR